MSKTVDAKKATSFPRFIQDGKSKTKGTFGSLDDSMRRQDLHKMVGGGNIPTGGNLQKTLDGSTARSQSMKGGELFEMDQHQMIGDFSLPGKPESLTIIPPSSRSKMSRAKAAKAVVDVIPSDNETVSEHEYKFLPQAMLLDIPEKYNQPSNSSVSNANRDTNQSSSDLEKITSIMESLKTGDDAINFFARFGADSPV